MEMEEGGVLSDIKECTLNNLTDKFRIKKNCFTLIPFRKVHSKYLEKLEKIF